MALKLTRNVLAKFLPNHEAVIEFENLFSQTNSLFSENAFISLGGFTYLQNSADNVGIGTETPTEKLELVGTSKFTGDMIIIGALTMTGNYGLTGNLTVNGTSIFNGTALDKDFTIKKLTSGNAYVYDAGLDTHSFSGTFTANSAALDRDFTILKLTSGTAYSYDAGTDTNALNGNLNVDGTVVFNSTAVDKDFTIKKLTSGSAYIYDAGADNHAFSGSLNLSYVAKTANYTLTGSDFSVDCTSNSFTLTLPTAVSATGRIYALTNTGTGTITLATTSSQTISGEASGAITLLQYESIMVQSNNANWSIIG